MKGDQNLGDQGVGVDELKGVFLGVKFDDLRYKVQMPPSRCLR